MSEKLRKRFLIIVRDEENFAVKSSYRFSIAAGIGLSFIAFLMVFGISILITERLMPSVFGGKDKEFEQVMQLVSISEALDSLASEVERRDAYIANLRRIFYGSDVGLDEETIQALVPPGTLGSLPGESNPEYSTLDSLFRQDIERSGLQLSLLPPALEELELAEMFFFPPVNGIISAPFDVGTSHYGIDLVANANEPIKVIANGVVILSSWTQDSGYVIGVQHEGNLLSFYKHNSVLLKKVGSFVTSGEAIAIIGNSGEFTDGPHLHFEVWHNGNPIDPEQIISF